MSLSGYNSDEFEVVEETQYVVMNFDTKDWEEIPEPGNLYSFVGAETGTPFFQCNSSTFQGEYDNACGTDLIFEVSDPKTLNYEASTFKKIKFLGVKLTKKPETK